MKIWFDDPIIISLENSRVKNYKLDIERCKNCNQIMHLAMHPKDKSVFWACDKNCKGFSFRIKCRECGKGTMDFNPNGNPPFYGCSKYADHPDRKFNISDANMNKVIEEINHEVTARIKEETNSSFNVKRFLIWAKNIFTPSVTILVSAPLLLIIITPYFTEGENKDEVQTPGVTQEEGLDYSKLRPGGGTVTSTSQIIDNQSPVATEEIPAITYSDNDGLTDEEEDKYGTAKFSADTDQDGYKDIEEIAKCYDPYKKDAKLSAEDCKRLKKEVGIEESSGTANGSTN